MKAAKYILILLLIVIIGGAIYFSLKDGSYEFTREKVIDGPPSLVFDQLKDFKEWENWNPWLSEENVTLRINDQTQGVDAGFSFTNDDGKGEITNTGLEPNRTLQMNLFYDNGFVASNSKVNIKLEPLENGTKVWWKIQGEHDLMNKAMKTILGFQMEKEFGPKIKASLDELDEVVQTKMTVYSIDVNGIIETGGGYHLYMSSSASKEKFTVVKKQMLQNIMSYMQRNNIDMYGMPVIFYEKLELLDDNLIFSAAIPVKDREITETDSNVLCSYQEPGKAVKITLRGDYGNLQEAWNKGLEFIAQNGLQRSSSAPYEIYKTDTTLTPNPADYLTEIYLPIQ